MAHVCPVYLKGGSRPFSLASCRSGGGPQQCPPAEVCENISFCPTVFFQHTLCHCGFYPHDFINARRDETIVFPHLSGIKEHLLEPIVCHLDQLCVPGSELIDARPCCSTSLNIYICSHCHLNHSGDCVRV